MIKKKEITLLLSVALHASRSR